MNFKITKELKVQDDIFDARFHPSKENLVVASTIGGSVYLIDNGEIISTLTKHHKGSPIRRLRFDKDRNLISIAKTIKIYDLESNQTIHSIKRNDADKTTFNAVLPLGRSTICAGDDSGKVFVWDTRSSTEVPVFSASDCEQYISDMDGKYEARRMFVCTSGEGTLTAYDLRASKMIEPQSELFEAGFQCVKMLDSNKKVVIGGEDGAIYVFNQNEWSHTSGKFAVSDDTQNRGKCSIEGIDIIPDSSILLVACSDGRMRSLTLWPHQIVDEMVVCKRCSLECLQVNPMEGKSDIVVGGENYINLISYHPTSDDEDELDMSVSKIDAESSGSSTADSSGNECDDCDGTTTENSTTKESAQRRPHDAATSEIPKPKAAKNDDDYLNIF